MEGLLDAAQSCLLSTVNGCLRTQVYGEECEKLSRWTVRLGLVLTQLRLCIRANEDLRGALHGCLMDMGLRPLGFGGRAGQQPAPRP